jgi:hypothetical protein
MISLASMNVSPASISRNRFGSILFSLLVVRLVPQTLPARARRDNPDRAAILT